MQRTPYPFTAPLPSPLQTDLDGTYVKFDPRPGERAGCKRCPPYPPEGGVWKLNLDAGVFQVYHERTGWRSLGSFTLSGDQIAFFNDPHCIHDVGAYLWSLQSGQLNLQVVEDPCGPELRSKESREPTLGKLSAVFDGSCYYRSLACPAGLLTGPRPSRAVKPLDLNRV